MKEIKTLLSGFYSLSIVAHTAHVNTRHFAFHEATGEFYGKVNEYKDRLIEYMMGEEMIKVVPELIFKVDEDVVKVADSVANMFCGWAKSAGHEALINMSGEFEEVVGKLKYFSQFK